MMVGSCPRPARKGQDLARWMGGGTAAHHDTSGRRRCGPRTAVTMAYGSARSSRAARGGTLLGQKCKERSARMGEFVCPLATQCRRKTPAIAFWDAVIQQTAVANYKFQEMPDSRQSQNHGANGPEMAKRHWLQWPL